MNNTVFAPADILLPSAHPEKWAVIACDQFTSQPEYWQEVEVNAGEGPSALDLIVPEAWLSSRDESAESERISAEMQTLLRSGFLRTLEKSYVYLERSMLSGRIRRGIVGAVDLDSYDYAPGTQSPVRATEETVEARLPARIAVRGKAALELPHIMLLLSEEDRDAFERIDGMKDRLEKVYDFDLMCGGGHICGWRISGAEAAEIEKCFVPDGGVKLIIGDGNHSLAAARKHWLNIKATLRPEEAQTHPARYCLAEVCGVWDEAIEFHPIHRVLFNADAEELKARLAAALPEGDGLPVRLVNGSGSTEFQTAFADAGSVTAAVQKALDAYVRDSGAGIDYVHGDSDAEELGSKEGAAAVIMPAMARRELFAAANESRIFPRKCFSIGSAKEKRYYLEARKIVE